VGGDVLDVGKQVDAVIAVASVRAVTVVAR